MFTIVFIIKWGQEIIKLEKKRPSARNTEGLAKFYYSAFKNYLINPWYSCKDLTPPSPPLPFLTASMPLTAASAPARVVM